MTAGGGTGAWFSIGVAVSLAALPVSAAAQQTPEVATGDSLQVQIAPAIVTVDIERLFGQSQVGLRLSAEITAAGQQLQDENLRIAAELRAEELALAAQRPDMDVEDFLRAAEAFDAKAQAIRRAQDAKETALEEAFSNGQTQFLDVTRPILEDLMRASGALAVLDRRSVVLSLEAIDVTAAAIERIDDAIGDGVQMPALDGITEPDGQ